MGPAGSDDSDGGQRSTRLTLDAILDLLAHRHRRAMLRYLRGSENGVPMADVVDHLVEVETERVGEQANPDHLSTALHHVHEPKLRKANVVTYDERTEEYQYHPDERLEEWLSLVESEHESEF